MKLPPGYVPGVGVKKATGFGGIGQTLLEKMGWQKGDGLGVNKHGMTEALEVKEKKDTKGVGTKQGSWDWEKKYWDDAYNGAIVHIKEHSNGPKTKKMKTKKSNKKNDSSSSSSSSDCTSSSSSSSSSSGSSDSDSSSSDSDSEPEGPTGRHRDGTRTSMSKDEMKIAKALAKDPWGRWGGRIGKMERIRLQEEAAAAAAAAALGISHSAVKPISNKKEEKKKKQQRKKCDKNKSGSDFESDSSSSDDELLTSAKTKGIVDKGNGSTHSPLPNSSMTQRNTSEPKRRRIVIIAGQKKLAGGSAANDEISAEQKRIAQAFADWRPTSAETNWWGSKTFVSAGLLDTLEKQMGEELEANGEEGSKKGKKESAFTELDQESLYLKTQELQRKGRFGIGRADGPLLIAGGNWEGTKKTFEEEGEKEQGEEGRKEKKKDKKEEEKGERKKKGKKEQGEKRKKRKEGEEAKEIKEEKKKKRKAEEEGEEKKKKKKSQ